MSEHGTYAGYIAHTKVPELPCDLCRKAKNAYEAVWRRKVREGVRLFVPALGSARRLATLVAIGWTYRDLAAEIGVNAADIGHIIHRRKKIRPDLEVRVCNVFDRVQLHPRPSYPPYAQRRSLMPPPLAWDEETIDDPDAQPAEWRRPAHALNKAEDIARDAAELMSYGESPENVAQRLGITLGSMQTAIRRAALRAERSA